MRNDPLLWPWVKRAVALVLVSGVVGLVATGLHWAADPESRWVPPLMRITSLAVAVMLLGLAGMWSLYAVSWWRMRRASS